MIKGLKKIYHYLWAWISALVYGHPSRELVVIGITGTKGKSTTVRLLAHIFESVGLSVAAMSSVEFRVNGQVRENKTNNTMPGRGFIQRFLAGAKRVGCKYVFLEVTSQGISQYRHRFIDFDEAGMTCLHPEHIESHGSFEEYRGAKVRFFEDVAKRSAKKRKLFFINSGSSESRHFEEAVAGYGRIVNYDRETFVANELGGDRDLLGDWFSPDFSLENAVLAFAIARSQDIPREDIIRALTSFSGFGGRMETIKSEKGFEVLIDYAHTPGSLEAVYKHIKEKKNPRRLIGVFGSAGGGRDKWKRAEFGKIASTYCDHVILTAEDPYGENPAEIARQIGEGIERETGFFEVEVNREVAIRKVIAMAEEGDVVAITGIGGQRYMHMKSGKIDWDERKIVERAIGE